MFFLTTIKESGEKAIVPQKWIHNLDTIKLLNYGIPYIKNILYIVYIPKPTSSDEPDFRSEILPRIDKSKSACYRANISKCFGKWTIDPLDFLRKFCNYCLFLRVFFMFTVSLDAATRYCQLRGLNVFHSSLCIASLNKKDIEIIQAILDNSSDDDDDEIIMTANNAAIPKPFKQ